MSTAGRFTFLRQEVVSSLSKKTNLFDARQLLLLQEEKVKKIFPAEIVSAYAFSHSMAMYSVVIIFIELG